MPDAFSLPKRFFELHGARNLHIDARARGVNAGVAAHGTRPHRHERGVYSYLGVNFVLRGSGKYIDAAGKAYELTPGTLFHRYPRVLHTTRFDPSSDYAEFYVVFDDLTGAQLRDVGFISPQPVMFVGVDPVVLDEFRHLVKLMRLQEFNLPSPELILATVEFINSLYRRAASARIRGFWERTIEDACSMLEHNLDERVHLETVAENLGVSYAAFRKHFTRVMGLSPIDYRIRARLEAARHMLGNMTIKDVARMLGYCDSFAFSAQFKRHFQISPREFKRGAQHVPVPESHRRDARPARVKARGAGNSGAS